MECLFCKIANKTLSTSIIYEDDDLLAFNDLHPQAPLHQLIIPKKHIATLNDLKPEDTLLMGKIILIAKKLAEDQKVSENGYRTVFNCNRQGGQDIYHIHLHLLAGRAMQWPPG